MSCWIGGLSEIIFLNIFLRISWELILNFKKFLVSKIDVWRWECSLEERLQIEIEDHFREAVQLWMAWIEQPKLRPSLYWTQSLDYMF